MWIHTFWSWYTLFTYSWHKLDRSFCQFGYIMIRRIRCTYWSEPTQFRNVNLNLYSMYKWAVPRENQHCWLYVKYWPDQPKHVAQANPDIHVSPRVDFLSQESLLYTSIALRRNVSARISVRRLRRLILVDTLRIILNVGFLVAQLMLQLSVSIPLHKKVWCLTNKSSFRVYWHFHWIYWYFILLILKKWFIWG